MAGFDAEDIEEIIVTLEIEGEGEIECEIICIFEYDGKDYAALTPTDESVEELYFFGIQMEEEDGDEVEISLENVEDDDLLQELATVFDQLMGEEDDGLEAMVDMDGSDDEEEDAEDAKWDEFITKKLDE